MPGKPRDRLQVAALEWRGGKMWRMAKTVGRHSGTVSRRLSRAECEGPEARHGNKSPGGPPNPDPEQGRAVEGDLDRHHPGCPVRPRDIVPHGFAGGGAGIVG